MKQKNTLKNKQKLSKKNNITIVFGYGLFMWTMLNLILWIVIPFSKSLSYPAARHFNIIVLIIAFAAAAILPALGSYILGDRATHIKNRALHHYNGVLFGIAAYWVASALSFIGYSQLVSTSELPIPFPIVVATGVPIILTIAIMTFVAITYANKQKHTSSVLEHRPYQIVLISSIIALYLNIALNGSYDAGNILWTGIVSLAFPVLLTLVSYRILAKYHISRFARLTDSVIAMSFGHITLLSIGSFIAYLNLHWSVTVIWSYVFALVVWIAYMYLRNRKST